MRKSRRSLVGMVAMAAGMVISLQSGCASTGAGSTMSSWLESTLHVFNKPPESASKTKASTSGDTLARADEVEIPIGPAKSAEPAKTPPAKTATPASKSGFSFSASEAEKPATGSAAEKQPTSETIGAESFNKVVPASATSEISPESGDEHPADCQCGAHHGPRPAFRFGSSISEGADTCEDGACTLR